MKQIASFALTGVAAAALISALSVSANDAAPVSEAPPDMASAPLMAETASAALDSSADRVSFSVEVQDLKISHKVFFATVLPGELLNIQVLGRPENHVISFEGPRGDGFLADRLKLSWKAPEAVGLYPIVIRDRASGEVMTLNVFVLEPASNIVDGVLNGYRIGAYPETPLRGNPIYEKPLGFIEVTPELAATPISPNFTLGQFLCKQQTTSKVKYVVLRPALLVKLEQVVALLKTKGIDTDTLFIMSGYRTPFYNAAIKNVPYSRHVYGDAADVYIDYDPRDGDMDDINGDGAVNRRDAAYLYDLVDAFDRNPTNLSIQGGIGEYDRNAVHGPFVHIDVRGAPARWGR